MIIKAGVTYFCKFAFAIYYMNHERVHLIVLMKKSFLSNILLYKYHLKLSSHQNCYTVKEFRGSRPSGPFFLYRVKTVNQICYEKYIFFLF